MGQEQPNNNFEGGDVTPLDSGATTSSLDIVSVEDRNAFQEAPSTTDTTKADSILPPMGIEGDSSPSAETDATTSAETAAETATDAAATASGADGPSEFGELDFGQEDIYSSFSGLDSIGGGKTETPDASTAESGATSQGDWSTGSNPYLQGTTSDSGSPIGPRATESARDSIQAARESLGSESTQEASSGEDSETSDVPDTTPDDAPGGETEDSGTGGDSAASEDDATQTEKPTQSPETDSPDSNPSSDAVISESIEQEGGGAAAPSNPSAGGNTSLSSDSAESPPTSGGTPEAPSPIGGDGQATASAVETTEEPEAPSENSTPGNSGLFGGNGQATASAVETTEDTEAPTDTSSPETQSRIGGNGTNSATSQEESRFRDQNGQAAASAVGPASRLAPETREGGTAPSERKSTQRRLRK